MADPAVIVEKDEAILTVTLNRPEKRERHQLRDHVSPLRCLVPAER